MSVKVAICGSGAIAQSKHIPSWQREKNSQLVALCDINQDAAEAAAKKFGIPKAYSDFGELLAIEKPDIVDICTPPKTHVFVSKQAMEGGANVMIEKPMAMTLEECSEIVETSKRCGKEVALSHTDLFYDAVQRGRKLVSQGAIGEFTGMRIFVMTHRDYITSVPDHWCHKLPGGVIGETGPHIVYLTMAFIDNIQKVDVTAHKLIDSYTWSPFEDYRIILSNGRLTSSCVLTYGSNQWGITIDLFGSEGMLKLDLETQTVIKYTRPSLKAKTAGISAVSEGCQLLWGALSSGLRYSLGKIPSTTDLLAREFVDCVMKGEKSPVPAEDGMECVRILKVISDQVYDKYGDPLSDK